MIHCRKEHPGHVLRKPEGTRNRVANAWIGILLSVSGAISSILGAVS